MQRGIRQGTPGEVSQLRRIAEGTGAGTETESGEFGGLSVFSRTYNGRYMTRQTLSI